jgi:hypothetical protein
VGHHHAFRCTGDDKFLLWNDTKTSLKVIDIESKKVSKTLVDIVKSIEGKALKPIFTVMTRKSHKTMLLGYTSAGKELVFQ